MPFIRMSTNIDINADRDARLRSGLGRAIELIPGKTERWLMIEIADNARLGLGGDKDTPAAIFTLKAFEQRMLRCAHGKGQRSLS